MSEVRCETCRFWAAYFKGSSAGTCRRNPPVVYSGDPENMVDGTIFLFPQTDEGDFCGQWKPGTRDDIRQEYLVYKQSLRPAKSRDA